MSVDANGLPGFPPISEVLPTRRSVRNELLLRNSYRPFGRLERVVSQYPGKKHFQVTVLNGLTKIGCPTATSSALDKRLALQPLSRRQVAAAGLDKSVKSDR
jgi:hypothetical protein